MWSDVIDIRDFYATPCGQVVRAVLRGAVRRQWPDVRGLNVLGVGYATPFLSVFRGEAQRVVATMPAPQGVLPWPSEGRRLIALSEEAELPFADLSMDRILLVHAVECTEAVRPFLREAWRVLSGSGRVLVVVPNRRGLWSRLERTPFGFGQPFSTGQLTALLRDCLFTPVAARPVLFVPPAHSRMILSSARAFERVGQRLFPAFSGAIMIEATKQIYAGTPLRSAARKSPVYQTARSVARPPA